MILMRLDLILQSEPLVRLASATGKIRAQTPSAKFVSSATDPALLEQRSSNKEKASGTPSGRLVAERAGAGKVCAADPRLPRGKAWHAFFRRLGATAAVSPGR